MRSACRTFPTPTRPRQRRTACSSPAAGSHTPPGAWLPRASASRWSMTPSAPTGRSTWVCRPVRFFSAMATRITRGRCSGAPDFLRSRSRRSRWSGGRPIRTRSSKEYPAHGARGGRLQPAEPEQPCQDQATHAGSDFSVPGKRRLCDVVAGGGRGPQAGLTVFERGCSDRGLHLGVSDAPSRNVVFVEAAEFNPRPSLPTLGSG